MTTYRTSAAFTNSNQKQRYLKRHSPPVYMQTNSTWAACLSHFLQMILQHPHWLQSNLARRTEISRITKLHKLHKQRSSTEKRRRVWAEGKARTQPLHTLLTKTSTDTNLTGHVGVRGILHRAGMITGRQTRTRIHRKSDVIYSSADRWPCLYDYLNDLNDCNV